MSTCKTPYLLVVVLYGKQVKEANTFRSLFDFDSHLLQGRCRLQVWDNSPQPLDPAEVNDLCNHLHWADVTYHHNEGQNIPLSTLYNRTIQLLRLDEILVILDDDSLFDSRLFQEADRSIAEHPDVDLFLPVVYNGHDIVSPAAMRLFKGHYLHNVQSGLMSTRHRTAINSGMMIRARYLKNDFEGYDERIRFYFTDNDFMSRYRASHSHFYVIDYQLRHKLDFYARGESFETKSRRFRELRRSFLILMRRRGLIAYIATQIYMTIYSIKFAIIHRDIRYIFIF